MRCPRTTARSQHFRLPPALWLSRTASLLVVDRRWPAIRAATRRCADTAARPQTQQCPGQGCLRITGNGPARGNPLPPARAKPPKVCELRDTANVAVVLAWTRSIGGFLG